MSGSNIIFYLLAALTLVSGVLAVTTRMIFRAAIYLLFSLIGIAGIYFWLQYEFIAAVQIVVYVGGIVVLIIFSIFLTQQAGEQLPKQKMGRQLFSALAAFCGLALVMLQLYQHEFIKTNNPAIEPSVRNIGNQMLGVDNNGYALPSKIEDRPYDLSEGLKAVKDVAYAKFDETVEVHLRLGVDPRHADQMVRGTLVLPHGTGKTMRVAVIAQGEKIKEAEGAGAEVVGVDDLVEKIAGGYLEFDALVATPDMMKGVGRLGKVLGPRGLMPNPKTGTVTFDVAKAIKEIKAGKVEYRVDKTAIIHAPVGKLSFGLEKLTENARALIDAVLKAKPSAAKGKYVRAIHIASTMGPSVSLSTAVVETK